MAISFDKFTLFDYLGITKSFAALWFVNNLIILAILSPLIYWLIKKTGIVFLILSGFYLLVNEFGRLSFSGGVGIFWFSVGAFISIRQIDIVEVIKNLNKWILLLVWIVFSWLCFCGLFDFPYWKITIIAIGVVVCFSWAIYFAKRWGVPAWVNYLAGASMFIYCFHDILPKMFFDQIFKSLYALWLPHNSACVIALTILEFIFIYSSSLAVYALLRRFCPRLCSVLSGGR